MRSKLCQLRNNTVMGTERFFTQRWIRLITLFVAIAMAVITSPVSFSISASRLGAYLALLLPIVIFYRFGVIGLLGSVVISAKNNQLNVIYRTFWHTNKSQFNRGMDVIFRPTIITTIFELKGGYNPHWEPPIHSEVHWIWCLETGKQILNLINVDEMVVARINRILQDHCELTFEETTEIDVRAKPTRDLGVFGRKLLFLTLLPIVLIYFSKSRQYGSHSLVDNFEQNLGGLALVALHVYFIYFALYILYIGIHLKWTEIPSVDFNVSYRASRNLVNLGSYMAIGLALLMNSLFLTLLKESTRNYHENSTILSTMITALIGFFSTATLLYIPLMIVAFIGEIWWSGKIKKIERSTITLLSRSEVVELTKIS